MPFGQGRVYARHLAPGSIRRRPPETGATVTKSCGCGCGTEITRPWYLDRSGRAWFVTQAHKHAHQREKGTPT